MTEYILLLGVQGMIYVNNIRMLKPVGVSKTEKNLYVVQKTMNACCMHVVLKI